MRLLIDAGNTRLKWQLRDQESIVHRGAGLSDSVDWLDAIAPYISQIDHAAVSTVAAEQKREQLVKALAGQSMTDVRFLWSEAQRNGLRNSYSDVHKMGADRWHAMVAAWEQRPGGFAVIDAGSAVTVDYVSKDGAHLGGYILPGKKMMLRSLQQDAARIGFESLDATAGLPGTSTTECVQHGLVWLWEGLVRSVTIDCQQYGLDRVVCTGGDGELLVKAGLEAAYEPDLVLAGLAVADSGWSAP